VWYRKRGEFEYRPGRTVAFSAELIPGIVEGLALAADQEPNVAFPAGAKSSDPTPVLYATLRDHGKSLHWEVLAEIVSREHPELRVSKWRVYNALRGAPHLFREEQEDVFVANHQ
jgi:hypothetical protein